MRAHYLIPSSRSLVVLVVLVLLLSACSVPGSSAPPHPLSISAALTRCAHAQSQKPSATVIGYFRSGPVLNGPVALDGALFDKASVPLDAASTPDAQRFFHGLEFGVGNAAPLAGSTTLRKIYVNSRLIVTGTLTCGSPAGIQPTAITIVQSG